MSSTTYANTQAPTGEPGRLCVRTTILTGDIIELFLATIAVDPLPSGEPGRIQGDSRWCGKYDADTQVDLRIVDEQLQDRQFAYWEGDGNLDNAESRSITVSVSADQTLQLNAWYYTPRPDGPRVTFNGTVTEFRRSINSWVAQVEVTDVERGPLSAGETISVSYAAGICPDQNASPDTDVPVEAGDTVEVSGLKLEDHVSIRCTPDRFTLDERQDREPSSDLSEYDDNDNCRLDKAEFLELLNDWIARDVDDSTLFAGIDAWIKQTDVCS